ncbi:FAD-dependent oxidoreductase [Polaromonas sp.]|uniref:oxidoreductase n=1 Tax=Polaromonas sp. TaxID=1869339 RepID=UPI003BAC525A
MSVATEPPNEHYPHLFAPFELAGKRLRNRIVHASISLHFGAERGAPDGLIDYHASRARSGAAMIVTEPIGVAAHQGNQRIVAWNNSMAGDLARWADAVESHDCRLIGQVQDSGRGRHVPGRSFSAIGPSALPDDISWSVPHAMSAAEISVFVESAAGACLRMKHAGFSGAEISAGHGHLFHQFLSPLSNHREDAYGGDLAGRCRFLAELCLAIRHACGSNFILGVKLPGDDGVPGGIGPVAAAAIAAHLTSQVHVDYLSYAQGSHHRTLEMHLPDGAYPRLPYLALTRELRRATPGVPVMALGRITDPAEAEGILAAGDIELVALGRPLITDATWPQKAQHGKAGDIRYCVSCNTCWKVIVTHTPIACDNNPRAGKQDEIGPLPPAATPRRIAIAGAGIAGLEAAMTAARRGHEVTVFGASAEVGGKTRLHAAMPVAESLSSIYDYQFVQAGLAGVRFELGQMVSAQTLIDLAPDAVVLATGAAMTWPPCLPETLQAEGLVQDLREAMGTLSGTTQPQAGTAVVLDMDHTDGTYSAIERLRDLFERVVVLTPRERIAEDTSLATRQRVQRRFHERGIEVICLVEPQWTTLVEDEGTLQYRSVFGGELKNINNLAFFAYATPRVPELSLLEPLRQAGIEVHTIGDCKVARGVLEATAEGYAAGLAL